MTPPFQQQGGYQSETVVVEERREEERGFFDRPGVKIAEGILGTAAAAGLGAFAIHEWRERKRHDASTGMPAFTEYQTSRGPILGRDSDGAPLFAARASIHGGWHIGKARDGHQACISYGGKEEYIKGNFQILCGAASGVTAVPQGGALNLQGLPSMPLDAGHEDNGEKLFIGVVDYKGSVQVGKVGPAMNGINFGYAGKEENLTTYRVVCAL
ncbi:hypothetical protein HK100_009631 [Physocladia obscura]|uniref:Uncharacterized protein n=1 Tax=Physocladia obscura TaxID=109957 RepID=A0AAD5TG21_9FUNG|nr:hypothetical protein HK100_009631 [Physocladia obscura]